MWIMIREGSAARNLEALVPLVLEYGPGNCLLCTDDLEPDHLLEKGHVNDVMRRAVELGCPAVDAVVMGTLNAARYHRLYEHGAIAPGYVADVVAVPDLVSFRPTRVWKRGRLVAQEGTAIGVPRVPPPDWMRGSVHVPELGAEAFAIPGNGRVRVIGVEPGQIVTKALEDEPRVARWVRRRRSGTRSREDGGDRAAQRNRSHRARVRSGVRSANGVRSHPRTRTTRTTSWSWAWTTGTSPPRRTVSARSVAARWPSRTDEVLAEVPCPIGGLLSDLPVEEVAASVGRMEEVAREALGATLPSPFMAMSFMALSVVPELKLTDRGLVDVNRFELVPLEVG